MTLPESDPDFDPEYDADPDEESAVTLAQLHEELIAGSSETRRGNRRMLDVLKNFGTVLDALSATVNDTHKAVRAIPAAAAARRCVRDRRSGRRSGGGEDACSGGKSHVTLAAFLPGRRAFGSRRYDAAFGDRGTGGRSPEDVPSR